MSELVENARALASATRGDPFDAESASEALNRMREQYSTASSRELDEALAVLVERIRSHHVEDADGTANLALTAGSLVEHGADPAPLARALLLVLPGILEAARRFADSALVWEDGVADDAPRSNQEVDYVNLSESAMRAAMREDRAGGVAFYQLRTWSLPAVASLSRCRSVWRDAQADERLMSAARSLRQSGVFWLFRLLAAELDQTWNVVCPIESRAFEVHVDGVVTGFCMHELLAELLVSQGVGERQNSAAIAEYVRGNLGEPPHWSVTGTFNFYSYQAAPLLSESPMGVPSELWLWNEGLTEDIPRLDGKRTVVVGPSPIRRSWNLNRTFSGVRSDIQLVRELSPDEVAALLARIVATTAS